MNNLQIRIANQEDAQFIALLGRMTFTETFGHLFRDINDLMEYYDRTFSVSKIRSGMQKPNNVFFIAFVDDLPVGYAKLKLNCPSEFIDSPDVSQLQKIYVLKDFLSMKVGVHLQNQLLERAAQTNEEIWLSVLHTNERAKRFYQKNGFNKIGEHGYSIGKEDFHFFVLSKKL
ncbi:MAG: GNAT family N-acetyltransferase [Bacteroidetes bacterium]|nr:MAG: GNAT family N-acetyltransferase [Bacteroidota bacterium]